MVHSRAQKVRLPFLLLLVCFRDRRVLQPAQVCDILKGVILVICYFMMHYVDYSMMYHLIRGQSVIKLYIIYNMLEVSPAGPARGSRLPAQATPPPALPVPPPAAGARTIAGALWGCTSDLESSNEVVPGRPRTGAAGPQGAECPPVGRRGIDRLDVSESVPPWECELSGDST